MSEDMVKEAQVNEEKVNESAEPPVIQVEPNIHFQIKLQEFDKNIAVLESQVADMKKQKMSFIYDYNCKVIADQHQEKMIRQQAEEETRKRLQQKWLSEFR